MKCKQILLIILLNICVMAGKAQETSYYGYIHLQDSSGDIPAVYTDAQKFSMGLAGVRKDGKWGFIDANNQVRIDFMFFHARKFQGQHSIVQLNSQYGVIDRKGAWVVPAIYLDLLPYTLEGKLYYISRNQSFYTGMLDASGKEVIPHGYTYIMPMDKISQPSPLYDNLPFYTVFHEIDTSKGSFYAQFQENAFDFTPSRGKHELYDKQLNPLVSREVTSTETEFSHKELYHINKYLEAHSKQSHSERQAGIQDLLRMIDTLEDPPVATYPNLPLNRSEIQQIMEAKGYHFFTGTDSLKGLKWGERVILPAQFKIIRWWGALIKAPQGDLLKQLKNNYAGQVREGKPELFELFAVAAGDKESGALYNLKGTQVFEIGQGPLPESPSTLGFVYRRVLRDTIQKTTQVLMGLQSWSGDITLAPEYKEIQVLEQGNIRTIREKETSTGIEAHVALRSASGAVIVPEGVFSDLQYIPQSTNLYLAQWDETYPSVEEQKEMKYAKVNRTYVVLQVQGDSYQVLRQFTASQVIPSSYDPETNLLKYRIQQE